MAVLYYHIMLGIVYIIVYIIYIIYENVISVYQTVIRENYLLASYISCALSTYYNSLSNVDCNICI